MRDYVELVKSLRLCAKGHCESGCMCFRADLPFAGCTTDFDEDDLKVLAADAIEELLAAVPKWISVDERLPEKHVEVLICTEDYGKNELGFANTAVWDGSEWIETWNRKESIPYVSHWMPLPVPPKEGTE